MGTHIPSKLKGRRVVCTVLIALALGLIIAVSLANAGQGASWNATELQLQNVSVLSSTVTMTYYEFDPYFGTAAFVCTDTLGSGQSTFYVPPPPIPLRAQLAQPCFGQSALSVTGTVHVDSSGEVLGVVTHEDESGGAAQWPLIDKAVLSHTAYVPHFAVVSGGLSSRLFINNLTGDYVAPEITFLDSSGSIQVTRTVGGVPPFGAQRLDAAALSLTPPFTASAVIQADRPIYVNVERLGNSVFAAAQGPVRGGFRLDAPMFAVQYNNLCSALAVQNINPITATGVLSYYAAGGSLLVTQSFTIAPFAAYRWAGVSAVRNTLGHVEIEANQPVVASAMNIATSTFGLWDYNALVVKPEPADTLDRRTTYGPTVYRNRDGWYSQIFVANLSGNPASIGVKYSSASTDTMTTTNRIIPAHGVVVLTDTLTLPAEFERASVSVTSDQLIASTIWATNSFTNADRYMAYEGLYGPTLEATLPYHVYLPLSSNMMSPGGAGSFRYVALNGVDTGNDCTDSSAPCATVQHAVDMADFGNEIRVAAGAYTGVQTRAGVAQMVYISKTVTIRGGYTTTNWAVSDPTTNLTILNAQGQGRGLYITGNISPTIEGLRIMWGASPGSGGGTYVMTATATLSGNVFISNTASLYGGGIYLVASPATLSGNIIAANTANGLFLGPSRGGGIYLDNSPAVLEGNTIANNTAYDLGLLLGNRDDGLYPDNRAPNIVDDPSGLFGSQGGGVYLDNSAATLSGNTFTGNTAGNGGGIYLVGNNLAVLSDNTFASNTADHGGAVYLSAGNAELRANTIFSNTALVAGGGVRLVTSDALLTGNHIFGNTALVAGGGVALSSSSAALNDNIIDGNLASNSGGGVYLSLSNATLVNNVIADNRANTAGSGAYVEGSNPRFIHTTFARNNAGDGRGLYVTFYGSSILSNVALTNTILVSHVVGVYVTNGGAATLNGVLWFGNGSNTGGAGVVNVTNAIVGDPAFDADGYHLLAGSAAIDGGANTPVTTDIDGQFRPNGAAPDLGADEFHSTIPDVCTVALTGISP